METESITQGADRQEAGWNSQARFQGGAAHPALIVAGETQVGLRSVAYMPHLGLEKYYVI
jgi:hypothetical protein